MGSVGSIRSQGRIFKGKKMPGHYGDEQCTRRNVEVVDVLPEDNVVLVKGPVPGARKTLVQLMKL